jgi:UrcA family protein
MLKLALGALATLAMAPTVTAAVPENPLVKDAVVLDLKNIDLATVSGQRSLAIRMDQAARAVCGSGLATIHLALEEQARTCRAEVIADVRSRIEARGAATTAAVRPSSRTVLASLR